MNASLETRRIPVQSPHVSPTAAPKVAKPTRASCQIAWRLLLTVHAVASRRINRDLQQSGCISFDDYDLLLTLNESPSESLRMTELAEAVLLSNSGLSRRVARLVERGLVHRRQCTLDGRVFHVHLSANGRQALNRAWAVYEGLIEQSFASHMTRDEAHTIGTIFQRILDRTSTPIHQGLLQDGATDAPKNR